MPYKEKSEGSFLIGQSEVIPVAAKGATPGPVIDAPIGGYQVTVGVEVVKKSSVGKTPLLVAVSFNGKDFSAPIELEEVNLGEESTQVVVVDLTKLRAPFYQLLVGGKKNETEVIEPKEKKEEEEKDPLKNGGIIFHFAAPTGEARR